MFMNIRKLAVDAIDKILTEKAFCNLVVKDTLTRYELTPEDRGLYTKLVYGTLRRLTELEYYLEPFSKRKKPNHWIDCLLCMSIYQLVYLNVPAYAAVSEAVKIAHLKDKRVAAFVNGVLRNFLRNPLPSWETLRKTSDEITYFSIRYSHPAWLVAFLRKDYSSETTEAILEENSNEKKDAIRINTLKTSEEEVIGRAKELGITMTKAELVSDGFTVSRSVIDTDLFRNGLITVQDIAGQMIAEICAPKEGSTVLDLCAAPGSKAAHMAALMGNTGVIYACDIYPHKIKLMKELFGRLGVTNVKTQRIDARIVQKHVKAGVFDYVLADVPCSGLGVLSHKVDLKYRITPEAITSVIGLQREILESSRNLVKPGGYYLYSTCTLNKEENEEQIGGFIKRHPEFEIVYERQILPFEYHTDGYYICKMRRNDEEFRL